MVKNGNVQEALLVLEDGSSFRGSSCGVAGEVFGELCFNTALLGYPEIISDPCYAGKLLVMTYPQIGNYGIAPSDLQSSKLALAGLIVRDVCEEPSSFRSNQSLPELLRSQEVVALSDIDTRALVQHVREAGVMRAALSTIDLDEASLLAKVLLAPRLAERNLVQRVSVQKPQVYSYNAKPFASFYKEPPPPNYTVVVYDCGAPRGTLSDLVRVGARIELVPWNTPAVQVLAKHPHGVVFSSGPGNPELLSEPIQAARELLGKVPLFGIGLGCQLLALAAGATTSKLKVGHHGSNHPVVNLTCGKAEISAQSHSFVLHFDSLGPLIRELSKGVEHHPSDTRFWIDKACAPVAQTTECGRVQLTHVHLGDGTAEGIAFLDIPAFGLQYRPQLSPGPSGERIPTNLRTPFNTKTPFDDFVALMAARQGYQNVSLSHTGSLKEGRP